MWQSIFRTALLLGFLSLAGCGDGGAPGTPESSGADSREYGVSSVDGTMSSRDVDVPITLVTPVGDANERFPLVVMAHGHGGSRWEGGAFPMVAEALAKEGIASIRMDFPGCGDSTEPFTNNNLTNMLADLQAGREYAVANAAIDPERIGLLGYSMGGRLVSLLSEIDPTYKAMTVWAPAVSNGALRNISEFGGQHSYDMLKLTAKDTGMAEYTTRWGTKLQLGYQWFIDMENSRPLDALAAFEGPLMVLYGGADEVVPPEIPKAALEAARSTHVSAVYIASARHGLGFYTERPEIAERVVTSTVSFLGEQL